MEGISSNKQNIKNEKLSEEQCVAQETHKRGPFTHTVFLLLLFIRKPVLIFTKGIAIMGAILLLFFVMAYASGGTMPYEIPMIILAIIFILLGLYANWWYDTLLLRLAPPGYNLTLFK